MKYTLVSCIKLEYNLKINIDKKETDCRRKNNVVVTT